MSVIVSAVCIQYYEFYIADAICCFVIAFLIIISVVPLLKDTIQVLVLGHDGKVYKQVQDVILNEVFVGHQV